MEIRVKICGVRTPAEARAAARAGADAIGLNFVPESPRCLDSLARGREIAEAVRPFGILTVGLFVNPRLETLIQAAREAPLQAIQLHGEEPPALAHAIRRRLRLPVWKAERVASAADLRRIASAAWPCDALLLDARVSGARGGTGAAFDWRLLAGFRRTAPLVLAGGLTPENVAQAVRLVRPAWVDVASGVESRPGVKDATKMRAFVEAARRAAAAQPELPVASG